MSAEDLSIYVCHEGVSWVRGVYEYLRNGGNYDLLCSRASNTKLCVDWVDFVYSALDDGVSEPRIARMLEDVGIDPGECVFMVSTVTKEHVRDSFWYESMPMEMYKKIHGI